MIVILSLIFTVFLSPSLLLFLGTKRAATSEGDGKGVGGWWGVHG